tara:strand:+ start:12328 stop:13761 length:1434 start_codon:yes stop_codon:yes gene_type:complete
MKNQIGIWKQNITLVKNERHKGLEKFKSFFTEAKEESYRLLIVSTKADTNNEHFHTAQRLLDEAKKIGLPAHILFAEEAKIIDGEAFNARDKKRFKISSKDTIAIIRGSVASRDAYLDLVSQLEKLGICVVNTRSTIQMCADKYWTSLRLASAGIPTPKTSLLQSEETLQDSLDAIGEEYPLILKTLRGSKGIGVLFIESKRQLSSLVQLLWKQDETAEILLQKYIKSDFDVRVIVLNDKVMTAMRRDVLEGDFRSNYSRGAKVKPYKLSKEEIDICLLANKSIKGIWTAVDFIKDGKNIFVLEVNSSPGTEGIEEASGENIVNKLLMHFKNRDNWSYVATEIGRYEIVELKGVGHIVANFDTGNSARAIIHADEYNIKNGQVIWKYSGKTYKHKLIKMRKFERGALDAEVIERPMIHLDVEFNGKIYAEVDFLIDDRSEKTTKCLMNQRFMKISNVMVNPVKTFVVSEKHDGFDIF